MDESGAESTEDMFFFYEERSDIIGIVDAAGNPVVEYKYDAWGKLLSTTCLMAYILGKYKLLRYRGYIYEEETELYYLRSCYYNPVFRRLMRMISNTLVWMGNCSVIISIPIVVIRQAIGLMLREIGHCQTGQPN